MGFSSASADSALMDFDPPSRAQLTVDWSMVKGWPSIVAEKDFSAAGLVWAVSAVGSSGALLLLLHAPSP